VAFAQDDRRTSGTWLRIPGWLVFVIFVPLQIWLFLHLFDHWRWWTLLFFFALGILGNRAARAAWLTTMLFPHRAVRHERRRHVFQGLLFLGAALTWLLPQSPGTFAFAATWPQPWLPLAFLVTLLKSALR
jgi:H+/Cl- antiporter ClcA